MYLPYEDLWLLRDSIRLLHLLPGTGEDPIRCETQEATISNKSFYYAVSYTWGPASDFPYCITLNGHKYHVRGNLYSALKRFQSPARVNVLWVDAICMNPKNVTERNHQVHMMGQIFAGAERVLIWLEKAANDSELAMDYLSAFPARKQDLS